jgi:Tol biopolymer transport system component
MSAILKDEPPPLPAVPALDTIIRRCLEKRPEQRFQSAADLAFALRSISTASGSQPAQAGARISGHPKWLLPAAVIVSACLLTLAGYLWRARSANQAPPEFERLTFRQGHISAARFAGDAVLYTANWEGGPGRTYLVTPGNPESRDLMMPENSQLLSVSAANDLALLVGPFHPDGSGTLARNSVTGGQTRELLENVLAADWLPDAASMALGRSVSGRWRLEFPQGKVVWESEFPPYGLRVSPDGERAAFCVYDEGSRIAIQVLNRAGDRQQIGPVSSQISTAQGARLFWTPDGREIWFRSFDTNNPGTIYGVRMNGQRRIIARFPGQITLHDVRRGGQALISTDSTRVGILGMAPGAKEERDLSVLDSSEIPSISQDGRMILADVTGASGGPRGSVYLVHMDGSPAVRLGEGTAFGFSPDGKWLTGVTTPDGIKRRFMLWPTGTGEEKQVSVPGLAMQQAVVVGWLPGDQNYLVMGALPGKKGWQLFAWDAVRGSLRPASPEGMAGEGLPMISPDGQRFLHRGPDSRWHVYSVADSSQAEVHGLTAHDIPAAWHADNHSIYVRTHADTNKMMRVAILDISTGERKPWKEIHPSRPVDEVFNLRVTPDGQAYAYNYKQASSDLYLVKGWN